MKLNLDKKNYIKLLLSLFVIVIVLISFTFYVSHSFSEINKSNEKDGYSIKYGDLNNDGNIETIDYQRLRSYFLGNYEIPEQTRRKNGDVNNDGFITEIDPELIRSFYLNAHGGLFNNTLPNNPITNYLLHGDIVGDSTSSSTDGVINHKDVIRLKQYLHGIVSLSPIEKIDADVNEDGKVDYLDLVILNAAVEDNFQTITLPVDSSEQSFTVYGDVNKDGIINYNDAELISQYISGDVTLTGQALLNADVNGDVVIDNKDYVIIRQFINGYHADELPLMQVQYQNYYMYGDVNNDGSVNQEDYDLLYQYIQQVGDLTEQGLKNAHINEDNYVDADDLEQLQLFLSNNFEGTLPYRQMNSTMYTYTYNVTYNANGGYNPPEGEEKQYGAGYQITHLQPQRENYEFIGWRTSEGGYDYVPGSIYNDNAAVTLVAQWKADDVTVYFNGNGGTGALIGQEIEVPYFVTFRLPSEVPTKGNNEFRGWQIEGDETVYDPGDYVRLETFDDTTINALWNKVEYIITYDANGGESAPEIDIKSKDTTFVLSLELPTRDGYTFVEWNTKQDGSGDSYASGGSYSENEDVTLYAQWSPITYTIAYNGNGATSGIMSSSTHTYDVTKPLSQNNYSKTGYNFVGWNTKADGKGDSYEADINVINLTAENGATITLYAQWSEKTYTISYNANGGENAPASQTKKHTQSLTLSSDVPSKTGHTFKEWNTKQYGSGDSYDPEDTFEVNADTVLYAQWEQSTFTLTFNPNGGTVSPESMLVNVGDNIILPTPTHTGNNHIFLGWYYDNNTFQMRASDGDAKLTDGSVTVYARWANIFNVEKETNFILVSGYVIVSAKTPLSYTKEQNGYTIKYYGQNNTNNREFVATGDIIEFKKGNERYDYIVVVLGDVNRDGKISMYDYMMVKYHLINKGSLDSLSMVAADVNMDNKPSMMDYMMIKQLIRNNTLLNDN